ncbi:hypothetical protein FPV67DRAFT_1496407 [Lyophyllum atratum]|nr:hypothetical protein FPV67DRAFT_1496407 [Lyophyllum atratum]
MWIESTFAFTVMEQWEKLLKNVLTRAVTIFTVTSIIVTIWLIKALPQRLTVMHHRAVYYWWGNEGDQRALL